MCKITHCPCVCVCLHVCTRKEDLGCDCKCETDTKPGEIKAIMVYGGPTCKQICKCNHFLLPKRHTCKHPKSCFVHVLLNEIKMKKKKYQKPKQRAKPRLVLQGSYWSETSPVLALLKAPPAGLRAEGAAGMGLTVPCLALTCAPDGAPRCGLPEWGWGP